MKNELEQQLSRVVEKAIELAEKTGEFVIEQAPLLLQEFYRWHITEAIIFICIGAIVWAICWVIANQIGRNKPFKAIKNAGYSFEEEVDAVYIRGRYYSDDTGWHVFHYLIKIAGLMTFIIMLLTNLYRIIFILVAPKLYLIEYFVK